MERSTVSTQQGGRSKGKPKGGLEGDVTPLFLKPWSQTLLQLNASAQAGNNPTGCELLDWILHGLVGM